jgi:hypothetical protein
VHSKKFVKKPQQNFTRLRIPPLAPFGTGTPAARKSEERGYPAARNK